MTARSPEGPQAPFLYRLLATAGRAPGAIALVHKHRGVWVTRHWRDVVGEIDRFAAGFRRLGVADGAAVAVEGEITARLFLVAAGALAAGARLRAVPPTVSAAERARVLADPSVAAVVAQGREAVAAWGDASEGGRQEPVVIDHATAGGRAPAPGVVTIEALRSMGETRGWEDCLRLGPAGRSARPSWVEESTGWVAGLDLLLDRWVDDGRPFALPELLAAAGRDRAEARPEVWIASVDRIEAAAAAIRERLPEPASLTGLLVAEALSNPRTPWSIATLGLVRRKLGLSRLDGVEAHPATRREPSAETARLFAGLGVPLSGHRPSRVRSGPRTAGEPARIAALVPAGPAS